MSRVKELFKFKTKNNKCRVTMVGLTFLLHMIDINTYDSKRYYLQLSAVDMWWFPKKDEVGITTLWGWLFFYIGCDTNMLKKEI